MCDAFVQASSFAAQKHRDQRRKNSTAAPYINHPLSVAARISKAGVTNEIALVGAVLHDTVEDTDTTIEEIQSLFGDCVAKVVAEVTDNKHLPKAERKRLQVERAHLRSYEAKLIKLSDKIDNLLSLLDDPPLGWDVKRIQGYFVWSKFVVEGLKGTNGNLEKQIDDLFRGTFVDPSDCSKRCECIPTDVDLGVFLEKYYESMNE